MNETDSKNSEHWEREQESKIVEKEKKKTNKNKRIDHHLDEQRNKEKKLIQMHTEEQSLDQYQRANERLNGITKTKIMALRHRLRSIIDPNQLQKEIRKIRNKELKDFEYYPIKLWERKPDNDIPEDVRRRMHLNVYDRFDIDDFRKEIEMRALSLQNSNDVRDDDLTVHEMLQIYLDDAKSIRDKSELRMRLEDLDALTAIIGNREIHDEL